MRNLLWPLGLLCAAGCSSGGDPTEPKALTGDRKLNRCLATLGVTTCQVGTLPATNPGAATKVRASLGVTKASEGAEPGDKHRVQVGVYDPEAGAIADPDEDGNALLAAGGAIVALTGAGGAVAWYLEDRKDRSNEIDIGGEEGTPVSVATKRGADPNATQVTVKTAKGDVPATVVAATAEGVVAIARLTKEHAGEVRTVATEGGEVIGEEKQWAVLNRIWFLPELIQSGGLGNLMGEFLPSERNVAITITLNCQQAPTLIANGQVTGQPGSWTVVFQGVAGTLSGIPLLSVVGTDQPVQASADVQEAP
ncbi:MAG: hypothetical protein HYY18_13210 [Planctomycetes bacterium]|nr:hypothetical protein [Planctomycetota bacterium]